MDAIMKHCKLLRHINGHGAKWRVQPLHGLAAMRQRSFMRLLQRHDISTAQTEIRTKWLLLSFNDAPYNPVPCA